jgi:hypothetical protein
LSNLQTKIKLLNPILLAYLTAGFVFVVETATMLLIYFLLPKDSIGTDISMLPIVLITIINAVGAWWFTLRAMRTYEPDDESRRVWRFIMFAMFMLSVGSIITFLLRYVFKNIELQPPTLADWLGYVWIFPCLFVALYRKYKMVKTVGKPNTIMMITPAVLVLFGLMVVTLSPFVSQYLINLPFRMMALAIITFTCASLIYALSILSEIHTGILSRSWKTLIWGVFLFALYYVLYFFILSNKLLVDWKILDMAILPMMIQALPILVALAAYFEIEIIG